MFVIIWAAIYRSTGQAGKYVHVQQTASCEASSILAVVHVLRKQSGRKLDCGAS